MQLLRRDFNKVDIAGAVIEEGALKVNIAGAFIEEGALKCGYANVDEP